MIFQNIIYVQILFIILDLYIQIIVIIIKQYKKNGMFNAVTPNDLGEHTTLTPWLSYVYVLPEYRHKGIANKMITWYLEHVKIRPLYLWCKHKLESFYSKFGFEVIDNRPDIMIMELL